MSKPNIEKLFQYLKAVSVEPIKYDGYLSTSGEFKLLNSTVCYLEDQTQIDSIKLNSTFFYNDTCLNCGGCDPAESNVFTYSEYMRILNITHQEFVDYGLDPKYLEILKAGIHSLTHKINRKEVEVYVFDQAKNQLFLPTRNRELARCSWCFKDSENKFKCRIHPVESITCIMPHLKFYHTNKSSSTSMGIHQFGRNWALKCPVKLVPPENESQFKYNKQNRIEKLTRLNEVGNDLNVKTYLPQVVEYIEKLNYENYKSYLNQNILASTKQSIHLF